MISSLRCKHLLYISIKPLYKTVDNKIGHFFFSFPAESVKGKVCVTHRSSIQASFRGQVRGRGQGEESGSGRGSGRGPPGTPHLPRTHPLPRGGPALKAGLSGSDRQQGLCWIPTFLPLLPQSRLLSPAPERGVRDCTGREGHWLRDRAHNAASQ